MRKNIVKIIIVFFIFCFASNIYATQIVSVTFSKKISRNFEPLEITDVFYPNSPMIHCIVGVKNGRRGTVVKGEWVSVDAISTPNYVIDSANVKLPGESASVHFSITKPNKGWPVGNYKLKIYVNNTYVTYAPFEIIAKKTVEPFAQARPKKRNQHKIIDSINNARIKKQNPITSQINQYEGKILGQWNCVMKYMGQNVGSGLLHFSKNGNAVINGKNFKYTLERGNILKVFKNSIISEYKYSFHGSDLKLVYNNGSFFYCQRATSSSPYSRERMNRKTEQYAKKQNNNYAQSYNQQYAQQHNNNYAQSYNQQYAQQQNNNYAQNYNGQYAQPYNNNQQYAQNMNSGQNWQLQGSYCTWSGSSYGGGSYSHTKYINFDGNSRWTFGESSSYSGSNGMYAGQGGDSSGTYQVKGNLIYYMTDAGERGSAQVYVRQNSGKITEIKVDGQVYAKSLCN